MNARILIVTNGPLCRNPRPFKEAATLARAGYEVTVLGVRNHRPSLAYDRDLLRDAPFRCEMIDMLTVGRPAVLARRLQLRLARSAARFGAPTIGSLGPARALLRHARRRSAHLTIVHNEVPFWVGTSLLAEGRRVAADMEDWYSEDLLPDDRKVRPLAAMRRIEDALLHRAAYTTTTSNALAAALAARYGGRPPAVITNAFPLDPAPRRGPPGQPPAFFWFSQTIGPGRGLEAFFEAWAQVERASRVVVLGAARAAFVQTLLARIPKARQPAVTFLPPVPPAQLPVTLAAHDIGLALERSDIPSRDLTITNKILQYLNAGLAVAATASAGQREVLGHASDAGVLLDLSDIPATAAALDALLADREHLARRQQAARQLAEADYCWEREAPKLLNLVAAALDHPSRL